MPPGSATERIRRLRVPVAIVHGKRDTMIRPVAALELWANAPEPRHLALVDGMGHSFQLAAVPAVTEAVEWVFAQPRPPGPPRRRR